MLKKFPKLKSKIILAPMHNTTNIAFRLLCKKYGAGLVSTELLSANAIARNNNAVKILALTDKTEKPVVAQIFGQNTEMIIKAGKKLEKQFDVIDFNCGCPSKKIIQQGSGSALLKRKNKIFEIIQELVKNIKIPITVKIRKGFEIRENAVEIARVCEDAGASAIIVHARSVEQGYSGKADWNVIREVKQAVKIPVIGNGDVIDGESCKKMFNETGCNYVMIGRAAIGNPFIFRQINEYLNNNKNITQTKEEKIIDFFKYVKLTIKYKIFSISDAKQKAIEFTKGIHGSKKIREKLNKIKSLEEIEKLLKQL